MRRPMFNQRWCRVSFLFTSSTDQQRCAQCCHFTIFVWTDGTVCCIDFHLLLKITTVHFSILPLSSVLKENVFIWMNTASTVYNSPKDILLRNCKIAIDSLVCLLFPARWIERRNTKGELFESLFNLCLFILCLNLICRHFHFYFCHQTGFVSEC